MRENQDLIADRELKKKRFFYFFDELDKPLPHWKFHYKLDIIVKLFNNKKECRDCPAKAKPQIMWRISLLHILWLVTRADTDRGSGTARGRREMSATVTYDKGQTAELFCSVTDLGDRTVTWRKLPNRNPLTIGPTTWVKDKRVHIEHVPNSSQWNLIIENVNASDAGTYECKVSARGTPFVQKVILEVKDIPVKRYPRIEISGRNFLKQGEDVHLQCNATMVDVNVDNLEWLKDGKPIADIVKQKRVRVFTAVSLSPQLTGSISSSLEIDNARVNDSGVYVCRSTGRSQLAGVKLEIKPDTNNSKRAENIQEYTGPATGPSVHLQPEYWIIALLSTVSSIFIPSVR